jgi:hypothetical protein
MRLEEALTYPQASLHTRLNATTWACAESARFLRLAVTAVCARGGRWPAYRVAFFGFKAILEGWEDRLT